MITISNFYFACTKILKLNNIFIVLDEYNPRVDSFGFSSTPQADQCLSENRIFPGNNVLVQIGGMSDTSW